VEIVLIWLTFAIVVGIAGNSRGRSGFGWFILAVIISPLIGLILVLVLPNLRMEALAVARQPRHPAPVAALGGRADRVVVNQSPKPFEPDGVLAGIPYRVAQDGSIEAVMQGATVKFRDFDKFMGMVGT
jgi:hypothetical protein